MDTKTTFIKKKDTGQEIQAVISNLHKKIESLKKSCTVAECQNGIDRAIKVTDNTAVIRYDQDFIENMPLLKEITVDDAIFTRIPTFTENAWCVYVKIPPGGKIAKHIVPGTIKHMSILNGVFYVDDDSNNTAANAGQMIIIDGDSPHVMRAGAEQVDLISVIVLKK